MTFWNLVGEIASGFRDGVANQRAALAYRNGQDRNRIERLCGELNWSVDERKGDDIYLHFNHRDLGMRKVMIAGGDESLVLFMVCSATTFSGHDVPPEVMGHLLMRNPKVSIGGWFVHEDEDGDVVFGLLYRAMGNGLDAPALKFICEHMIAEVVTFDKNIRAAGMLR